MFWKVEWDHTHNDIEVYDNKGRHLGSMDPTTDQMGFENPFEDDIPEEFKSDEWKKNIGML